MWGTYPREQISPDESIATFTGCDADLLNGARTIFLISYAIIGVFTCVTCTFLGLVVGEVLRDVERAQAAGRGGPMV